MSDKEQVNKEGLRQLLDRLNSISGEATKKFESQISEIDQKAEQLSKPLDQTWNEWQPASKLIYENSHLTIVRIDEDDSDRVLLVSHHSEIGRLGYGFLSGVETAPGSTIEIHGSESRLLHLLIYSETSQYTWYNGLKTQKRFLLWQKLMK